MSTHTWHACVAMAYIVTAYADVHTHVACLMPKHVSAHMHVHLPISMCNLTPCASVLQIVEDSPYCNIYADLHSDAIVCTQVCTHVHTQVRTHVHAQVYADVHAHACVHVHMHVHVCAQMSPWPTAQALAA